jgi:hypothetical protein
MEVHTAWEWARHVEGSHRFKQPWHELLVFNGFAVVAKLLEMLYSLEFWWQGGTAQCRVLQLQYSIAPSDRNQSMIRGIINTHL